MKTEEKKALVFAGGGSKGAYQIGAWKALRELKEEFQIATGTSIGSINAALYVQQDFDEAFEMWNNLRVDSIMTNGINLEKSVESILSQREQFRPFIKNFINQRGADVTPFHGKLKEYFNADKFFSSDIDFALVTVKYPSFSPYEVYKRDMKELGWDAWKWLAASGACYPVFPVMNVNGEDYVDGGYFDNIPVAPAFKLGASEAVVIDLKPDKNHEGYIHHPRIKYIKPSRDLGTFLNFEQEALRFSIGLGYNDTMKAYGKYLGTQYTFLPDESIKNRLVILAGKFIDLLTLSEARFDFSGNVRGRQRVNNLEGCTTLLSASLGVYRPSEVQLFIAALEAFMAVCSYDLNEDYSLYELLFALKNEVDGMYPLLEYDTETAFSEVRKFVQTHSEGKNPEQKKLEDDRMMLIYTSFIRALQHIDNI
ncbi:MAG: patatin-like phospholipase family protein [Oscillospiraceae bacterium]|nr:patatin-like phospholipase family protein [Oscillospiraceae bacterium]